MSKIKISGFADEICADFDEQLSGLVTLGMEYICLRAVDKKGISEYSLDEFKSVIVPKLDKNNIKVSSLGSPIGKILIDDEEGYEKQKKQLEVLCQMCNELQCKYIRMFSFYMPKDSDPISYKEQVIEKLKVFVNIAEKYNVILIHENEKGIYGDTGERCRELFTNIKSPCFKAAFDFANFVQCEEDTLECWDKIKENVVYIHIKDANASNHQNVLCGTGDGNITQILKQAIDGGYEGFLTLEPHLFIFDTLQTLEVEDANNIIKKQKYNTGFEAYKAQYDATKEILSKIM